MVKDLNDPTNVDMVPAMLTPGEYVVNKEATAMYGPLIHQMNQHGLQQRVAENNVVQANIGKKISKLHGEGYTAPGQAYAIAKSMGYNTGGIVDFIKQEEGFRDKAYKDPVGKWTIGYGRTTNPDGSPVKPGQTTSREAEDQWINQRVAQERAAVEAYGKEKGYSWDQNQIDALASFRYNGGQGMLENLTGDGKRSDVEIAGKILQYNKGTIDGKKVELGGLTKRRQAEANMFSSEIPVQAPTPTQAPPQVAQAPAEVPAPPASQGIGAAAVQLANLNRHNVPIAHQANRRIEQAAYIPSQAQQRGPISSMRQPVHMNAGGWLTSLFNLLGSDDQKKQQFGQALGNRPGVRSFDPLQGMFTGPDQPQVPTMNDVPPQVPMSDEEIINNSSQQITNNYAGQDPFTIAQQISQLTPDDQELALNSLPPDVLEQVLNAEEQQYKTNEALQQAQLQASVTSPDAPGAQFIQDRVDVLSDQLNQLQVPPSSQGVGVDVNVAPDGTPLRDDRPIELRDPADVGAVPNVDQDAGLDPDFFDPRGDQVPYQEKRATAENAIAKIEQQAANEPVPEQTPTIENAINVGQRAVANMPPAEKQGIMGTIKEAFGELFNKKELVRMGVLMAGAMATGMSPGRALAFAGQNYIQRIDAMAANKTKHIQDLVKGQKYTSESIKAYKESGDPSVLIPNEPASPIVELGNSKEFYSKGGKRIQAREIQIGDNKIWVDGNNKPVNLNAVHEDPQRVPGTPEHNKYIQEQTKLLTNTFDELQKRFGTTKGRDGSTIYGTDLVPGKVGHNAAKWAVDNNVPPEAMGQLLDNAYQQALSESRDGKKARSITAYLNDQYIRSQVGDPSLFQTRDGESASAEKINNLMSNISRAAGLSGTVTSNSTVIMQKARPLWAALDEDVRKIYNRQAGPGETGFMKFLEAELAKGL